MWFLDVLLSLGRGLVAEHHHARVERPVVDKAEFGVGADTGDEGVEAAPLGRCSGTEMCADNLRRPASVHLEDQSQ